MKDGKIGELRSFVRDRKEQEEQQAKNKLWLTKQWSTKPICYFTLFVNKHLIFHN